MNTEDTNNEVVNDEVVDTTPDTVPVVSTDEPGTPEEAKQPGEGEQGDGEPEGEPEPTDPSEPTDAVEPEFFFGESQVTIDIPEDVSSALSEKGLDAKAIAAELYSKGGEFKLSEETLGKLYEAFGKFSVDAYLSGLKATNEGFVHNLTRQDEQRVAADAERYGVVSAECGGDDGWSRMEQFALETLDDEKLAAFNEVMRSGNQYLQQYAVRELESQRKAIQGDDRVDLLEPSAVRTETDGGPLSQGEYIKAISELSTKFNGDRAGAQAAQANLDKRRMAGMSKGI